MVPQYTEGNMILEGYIKQYRKKDDAFNQLVTEVETLPADTIAAALREYIERVAVDRVTFSEIFGYRVYSAFELITDGDPIETALDAVDWSRVAEEVIHDSHRWDAYISEVDHD